MKKIVVFILFLGAFLIHLPVLTTAKEFSFGRQRGGGEGIAATKQINVTGVKDGDKKDSLLDVIRGVTNRVLGILGFIALVLALYGGFLMVTAAGDDDAYGKGRGILKSALIGLAIIGLAWFIVSIVLWLIQNSGNEAAGTEGGTG